jgi:ribose 5-phosphate isomerase A
VLARGDHRRGTLRRPRTLAVGESRRRLNAIVTRARATTAMDVEAQKLAAAARAIELVRPGMRLGVGSGSTARHFVELLAERVREGIHVVAVPTSEETRALVERLGIPVGSLDDAPEVDLAIDGADEIAPDLTLIKGGGGALLREKIVASSSASFVVIADQSKLVRVLGWHALPMVVVPYGFATTRRAIQAATAAAGAPGLALLRRTDDGRPRVTDDGHWIVDASLGHIDDPELLSRFLDEIPGVVEHGLFVDMADAAIVAGPDGVRTFERPGR